MNYNVNWERTVEHINFLLQGRTHKKNFSELFGVEGRAVQRKLSATAKQELSISELMMLADYLKCDIMDLVICEDDAYRDNVLRVKGVPGNNLYGLHDKEYNKYYYANLQRYFEDGNSGLWSYEYRKQQIEKKRKESLGL